MKIYKATIKYTTSSAKATKYIVAPNPTPVAERYEDLDGHKRLVSIEEYASVEAIIDS